MLNSSVDNQASLTSNCAQVCERGMGIAFTTIGSDQRLKTASDSFLNDKFL